MAVFEINFYANSHNMCRIIANSKLKCVCHNRESPKSFTENRVQTVTHVTMTWNGLVMCRQSRWVSAYKLPCSTYDLWYA